MKTLTANNRVTQCIQLMKLIMPKEVITEDVTEPPNFIQDIMDIDEKHFKQQLENERTRN